MAEIIRLGQEAQNLPQLVIDTIFSLTQTNEAFRNKTMLMMGRKTPDQWTPELATEFIAQARLLLWIMGPIWVASGMKLPQVTGLQLSEWLDNEPHTDWDEFYHQFGAYNVLWQRCVDDALLSIKMSTSRFIVGRIAKFWMELLPEPLEKLAAPAPCS